MTIGGVIARPRVRLDSLTGLRFVAALLVFGHHISTLGPLSYDGANLLRPGTVGVSFFFILSGFILAWTGRPGDGRRAFWRRRFARVVPAYIAALLAVTVVNVASGDGFTGWNLLPLTLLQSWVPSETAYFATSAVFWSLSTEAFFYLIFPLVFPWMAGRGTRVLVGMSAGLVLAVVVVAFVVNPVERGSVGNWFFFVFPPVRFLEFALGIIAALLLRRGALPGVPMKGALSLAGVACVVSAFVPLSFMSVAVTLVPFMLLIIATAQADLSGKRTAFARRQVVALGDWSYAFYLTHITVIAVYLSLLEKVLHANRETLSWASLPIHVLVMLALSTAAAAALHRWVEAPMEKRLRGGNSVANQPA